MGRRLIYLAILGIFLVFCMIFFLVLDIDPMKNETSAYAAFAVAVVLFLLLAAAIGKLISKQ